MKAVIFDLGHTLIDYYSDWRIPENRAVSRFYDVVSGSVDDPPEEGEFIDAMILELEGARKRRRTEMIEIPLESFLHDRLVQFGVPPSEEMIDGGLEEFYQALLEHRRLVPAGASQRRPRRPRPSVCSSATATAPSGASGARRRWVEGVLETKRYSRPKRPRRRGTTASRVGVSPMDN